MTENRGDRYRDSDSDDSEYGIEPSEGDIDEYAARAALDSSGRFFNWFGVDEEGHAHYVKERDGYADVAVIDPDEDVLEYHQAVDRGRLESYVWEKEWEVLTEYGEDWLHE